MKINKVSIRNFRKFKDDENEVCFNTTFEEEYRFSRSASIIVGQNNSGKTSLIKALDASINLSEINVDDVNYEYINNIRKNWNGENGANLSVEIKLYINLSNGEDDILSNLYEFIDIDDVISTNSNIEIIVRYQSENLNLYEITSEDIKEFSSFYEKIKNIKLKRSFVNKNNIKIQGFNLSKLIDLKIIKANNIDSDKKLTESFSKILKYQFDNISDLNDKMKNYVKIFNDSVKNDIDANKEYISINIDSFLSSDEIGIELGSNLKGDTLLKTLIKYSFKEKDYIIPETQFGLGYTNLIHIVAEVIDYVQKFDDNAPKSMVTILAIEEPETFMHPQMQSNFIETVDRMINSIIITHEKLNLEIQTLITTHSNNILISKLQASDSFNNIIYFDKNAYVQNLSDSLIVKSPDSLIVKSPDEKFIKKHVRIETANMFFADAIIFVEGITEKLYLKDLMCKDSRFKNFNVDVYIVNGTHATKYNSLIENLKIPTLVITDLDIKSEDDGNISDISGHDTTNPIFKKNSNLSNLPEVLESLNIEIDNRIVVTQNELINGYYATSFEEAFILTNKDSNGLKDILQQLKPRIFKKHGDDMQRNSRIWQKKLVNNKFDFVTEIMLMDEQFSIPAYIEKGINDLHTLLTESNND